MGSQNITTVLELAFRKTLWLKDESLEDSANLFDSDIIAAEIVDHLEAALSRNSR